MSFVMEDARRSFFWSFLDKWVARVTQLLVFVILGRLLRPEDFGLVAIATAYLTLTNVFVDSGFGKALVQKKNVTSRDLATSFSTSLTLGSVIGGLTVLLAPAIADMFDEPDLVALLVFMSVSIFLHSAAVIPASLLERNLNFKALAVRRTVSSAMGGVIAIAMAAMGFGVWSLAAQTVVTSLVACILVWVAYRSWPGMGFDRKSFAQLRGTGFSVLGIELLGFANSQADKLIIGAVLGAELLGYYFLAMRVISITVELFTSVFSSVSLSVFSKLQSEPERIRRWLGKLTTGTTLLTIPVFTCFGLFSSEIVDLVFGLQWDQSAPILRILVFLGLINSVLVFDRSVLIAVGKSSAALWLTAGQTFLGVILLLVASPLGILPVALAVVVRQYAYWPVRLFILHRVLDLNVPQYVRPWLGCFALAVIVMLLGRFVDLQAWLTERELVAKLGLFVAVFGVAYLTVFRRSLLEMLGMALRK